MAYTPTGTFIPCNTNGFITEKYSKSYKFSIVKPTTYPGEENVNGVIWVMDLEAMSKTESPSELQTAKWAAGKDYSDEDHPVDYPLVGNYYIVANLYSFPNENPKTKFSIEGNYSIKKTRDNVKYLDFNTTKLFRVKETKELNSNSTVDDLINLALDYLRNDYINTVYGRFADPVWKDAYQKKEEKKITEEKLTEVYDSLGNLPENKISLKIDEAGATPPTTGTETTVGNTITAVKVESPTAVAEVQFKFNVEKTDTFVVVGGTVSPPLEFTIVPNDGAQYLTPDVFNDDDLGEEYQETGFSGLDEQALELSVDRPMETASYQENLNSGPNDVLDPSPSGSTVTGEAVKNPTVAEAIVTVMNALIKEGGLSVNEAAGVCGNIKAESGFKFWNIEDGASNVRPSGMGSNRWDAGKATGKNYSGKVFSGTGLAQWTYGRRYNYEKYVGEWLTKKGVSTKALKNGFFDTDPGLHSSDYNKVYGGAGDQLEAYLKTVPHLFDAACSFLQHELKTSYAGIIKIMRGANPSGNAGTLIKNGFFVNKSGGKVAQTVEGFAELVVCNFEVPGPVGQGINGKGRDDYNKLVKERTKLAQDCLATYNKSASA